ncbi:MAG: hypothetical protein ACPHFR_03930 [Cycloclasticus sp.]
MNWDTISAIGDIVGAAAVVVSLLYLAAQVRTQNQEARLAAMHDITVGYRDCLTTFTEKDISELVTKANEDFASLTDAEAMRLISSIQRLLRVGEEAYIQYEAGRLDERIWAPSARQYASYLSLPCCSQIWQMRRTNYDEKFAQLMDELKPTELKLK